MKKKVDPRIRQTLQDAVANNHRAVMLLVGDKARDQVVNLHYMLAKLTVQSRPTVLWCYKKELGFSSNKKKRMKVIKKRIKQGLVDPDKDDPFELFISATTIRFAYYSESHKILGNTYGMCVLQDFEALTPNLLARTIETVQGGGLILILINKMNSLKQLFSLAMDSHSRLRTEAHHTVVPRFNERFILSLADCPSAIVADDELNVLPISSHVRSLSGYSEPSVPGSGRLAAGTSLPKTTDNAPELTDLKNSLSDTQPIGPLIAKAKTIDQAKALLRFEEAISEKTLRSTVALTASRGRGKSAALGLAVAAAVAHDYSNIFVTSPSPENLRTFFAFLFIGFDSLEFQEHTDYEIIQSTDPNLNKAVVRVNIFRNHRQTVQYLDPTDAPRFLSHAELLVIDEAAAIPLPLVEAMLGPYVVFMCSTVTGYEGTGRSLSLKLIKKLREGSAPGKQRESSINGHGNRQVDREASAVASRSGSGRVFREVHMDTPIRYGEKDPIEAWLYDLLCLEAGGTRQTLTAGAPHPSECELYYVERDALFSRHSAAEAFLHRVMALFVSSHYKNTPNDLQMLSDAPAHSLFVLLAPTRADTEKLPDVLCAIQVCLEGRISSESSKAGLSRGQRRPGDLIPWTVGQQFQEPEFATLSGARVIRVATHADVQKMGYGTRAMQLLMDYYAGKLISLEAPGDTANDTEAEQGVAADVEEDGRSALDAKQEENVLLKEIIGPRKDIPPLLRRLHERLPERLDYLGVSYGLTQALYAFWSKLGFLPLYLRLTSSELTGEHTCIMATCKVDRSVGEVENASWLTKFHADFRKRFLQLLGFEFRKFPPGLAMAVLGDVSDSAGRGAAADGDDGDKGKQLSMGEIKARLSVYDRRRLESYSRNLVDYHVIVDLLPKLCELYLLGGLGGPYGMRLSAAQTAVLVSLGLQRKTADDVVKDLGIQSSQMLALLNKVVRKISNHVREREEREEAERIGPADADAAVADAGGLPKAAVGKTLDEDLQETVREMTRRSRKDERAMQGLEKFRIAVDDAAWGEALPAEGNGEVPAEVSVKAVKRKEPADGTGGNGVNGSARKSFKKRRKV